ncbi:hypothetical protein [Algoriphagus boritolerans]|uniref:hypothetical protein n=1 Tax=Algoriphagus boritolerans TaxID=308111 RepID=UPI001F3B5FE3|nr:hypothetical protein [Algoriphagus boritolerans]
MLQSFAFGLGQDPPNHQNGSANAVPIAESENSNPEKINNRFLPYLSLRIMHKAAPIMQPTHAELVPQP